MFNRITAPPGVWLFFWCAAAYFTLCLHLFGKHGVWVFLATPVAYIAALFWLEERRNGQK